MSAACECPASLTRSLEPALAAVFQTPFVDLFKQVGLYDGKNSKVLGDVKQVVDRQIGKRVYRIHGSISAANYIDIPGEGSSERMRSFAATVSRRCQSY